MDKHGTRILIGCTLCSLIIMGLLLLALRLSQPSCQLIFIEPALLRSQGLSNLAKEKPARSHDKSLLLKLSAHLEYHTDSPASVAPYANPPQSAEVGQYPAVANQSPALPNQNLPQAQPAAVSQLQPQQQQHEVLQAQQQLAPGQPPRPAPQPSVPMMQVSPPAAATNWTANIQTSTNREPRFLPLKVEDLEMRRLGEDKFKYSISFNCSSMSLVVVRRQDRVYVEQASIELRPANRRHSSCELRLPQLGSFGVEVNKDGWAHYHCDKPITYSCYYYSSRHAYQPGQLLADLHIHSIEFETGSNSTSAYHKSHEFLSPRGRALDC